MEITENVGLPMALVDVAEALETDWEAYRERFDVVRVAAPDRAAWPALRAAGFLPKPSWVTWVAATGDSEESYLAGLRRKERQSVTAARRHLDDRALRLEIRPLDEPLLDRFLEIYGHQVRRMRHALPVALRQRDDLLAARDAFYAVCVLRGDTLTGGCLCQRLPEAGLVRLRFSAVDEDGRARSLARVLYLEAIAHARRLGFADVSLGNDPNLYGHVVETGLFTFKTRLGFTPVPSQTVHPHRGTDCADLVLNHRVLTDPALFLSYGEPDGDVRGGTHDEPAALGLEFFTGSGSADGAADGAADARRWAGSFTGTVRTHPWPGATGAEHGPGRPPAREGALTPGDGR